MRDRGEEVEVYGFGSYFRKEEQSADIDLALIHANTIKPSCEFAIKCKTAIQSTLPNAHITMLSRTEESSQSFLLKAKAISLMKISEHRLKEDVETLVACIQSKTA